MNTYFFDVIIAVGVKYKYISWFILFTRFLFQMGDGGQAGGEIWVYIEFIVARLPTLQILYENNLFHYCTLLPEMNPILLTEPIIQGSGFQ